MPKELTAYHDSISPGLNWREIPPGTRSVAILCEDPDAIREPSFVHWLIANMPPQVEALPSAVPNEVAPEVLVGGIQGTNDKGTIGYFGPRPPAGTGTHHYHFHVLALDKVLELQPGFDRSQFQDAITDHVIGQGAVVGTFDGPES